MNARIFTFVLKLARGLACNCIFPHTPCSLSDSRNKEILKQYDLMPDQPTKFEYVYCNMLVRVPKGQRAFHKIKRACKGNNVDGPAANGGMNNFGNLIISDNFQPSKRPSSSPKHGTRGYQ